MKVGLRFLRRDANRLRALARRVHHAELPGGSEIFVQAARAAEMGEPLVVVCTHPDEAVQMADGYTIYGVTRPAVEALSED